jgi:hypothetical protein
MKEIRIEADRMEVYDEHGNRLSKFEERVGNTMCLGDFTMNEIAIALALYRTLLDIDEKEVKITDSDFETFNK